MKFDRLFHLGKNGALYAWDIWVEGDTIHSETGQVGGQFVHSRKVAKPKNVGRANATTADEQAVIEAKAMHRHKLDRKYSLTPEEAAQEEIQPMLADKFEKRKKKDVSYPCHVQPKLDGCRALAYWDGDRVVLTSRGNKEWEAVSHINKELEAILPKGSVLDGELFIYGTGFQTLSSWMKRKQDDTLKIEFHVYDMPAHEGEDTFVWEDRKAQLDAFFANVKVDKIKYVETFEANSENEVYEIYNKFLELGYEGAMARMLNAPYIYGYRSHHLLKLKPEEDAEYKVVGVTTGVGKFERCAIWICEDTKGQRFNVTPKCTQAEKERYLREADKYIGQMLTVEFNDFTDKGLPRFGRGKGFRPVEDLSKG